jgi:hypothetical protein
MSANNCDHPHPGRQLEEEFNIAFGLLRRCPQVSEIDFDSNCLSDARDVEKLKDLAERHGLSIRVRESGRVNVFQTPRALKIRPITRLFQRGLSVMRTDDTARSG